MNRNLFTNSFLSATILLTCLVFTTEARNHRTKTYIQVSQHHSYSAAHVVPCQRVAYYQNHYVPRYRPVPVAIHVPPPPPPAPVVYPYPVYVEPIPVYDYYYSEPCCQRIRNSNQHFSFGWSFYR